VYARTEAPGGPLFKRVQDPLYTLHGSGERGELYVRQILCICFYEY